MCNELLRWKDKVNKLAERCENSGELSTSTDNSDSFDSSEELKVAKCKTGEKALKNSRQKKTIKITSSPKPIKKPKIPKIRMNELLKKD